MAADIPGLHKHRKIAFDFDGTLVDGRSSLLIQNYIQNNDDKTYFIVTFRTPVQAKTIPMELAAHGLSSEWFATVVPMAARLALEFDEDQRIRRNSGLPNIERVSEAALLPGERQVLNWKGFVAKKLGATVLVDDMPAYCAMGCRRFGIRLLDANHLTEVTESRHRIRHI